MTADWDWSNNTWTTDNTSNTSHWTAGPTAGLGLTKAFLYQFEQAKQDYLAAHTCPYCGCLYQDDGKPNCSQCGAPKRGGSDD